MTFGIVTDYIAYLLANWDAQILTKPVFLNKQEGGPQLQYQVAAWEEPQKHEKSENRGIYVDSDNILRVVVNTPTEISCIQYAHYIVELTMDFDQYNSSLMKGIVAQEIEFLESTMTVEDKLVAFTYLLVFKIKSKWNVKYSTLIPPPSP